ncbi:hypothetical protein C4X99_23145 [Leptospira interrogans serovar Geyaweera]|nr:hypothetical protein C4X99_23145 [Leptospira interrogans serovar Geyaweera]
MKKRIVSTVLGLAIFAGTSLISNRAEAKGYGEAGCGLGVHERYPRRECALKTLLNFSSFKFISENTWV